MAPGSHGHAQHFQEPGFAPAKPPGFAWLTRLQRRLGTRDRWFIALLVSALLIGALATIVAGRARADSSSEAGARCVAISRASWMGSATIGYCGAQAVAYCRESTAGQSAAGHAQSVAECERAGLRTAG